MPSIQEETLAAAFAASSKTYWLARAAISRADYELASAIEDEANDASVTTTSRRFLSIELQSVGSTFGEFL